MILEASDLWVAPPDAPDPVVRGFSIAMERGQWLSLEGSNGSGKTTLLMAIAGLWPIRRGALRLDGRPWGPAAAESQRGAVAVVMQEPSSQLLMGTVAQELEFSLLNLGWDDSRRREATVRWSEALGLAGLADRNPLSLSAGEQQRLLLGAALAAEPGLLVCDEGGAHLDSTWRGRVLGLVRREVAERGMAVVWASQDRTELAAADRALCLGAGPPGLDGEQPRWAGASDRIETHAPVMTVHVRPPGKSAGPTIRIDRPLTIEMAGGGTTAICGPNGSGKSVLLAAIAGVEGCAQVVCERPGGVGPAYAGQFPDRQVFADCVADEILYGPLRRGRPRSEVSRELEIWLPRLGYASEPFLKRRTWGLSAAERRLVTLAGALLSPAPLLAVDEPTVGLDPARSAALAGWISEKALAVPVVVAGQDERWIASIGARTIRLGGTY